MDEFEIYLHSNTDLSDEEIGQMLAMAIPRTLKRNDFLLREGEICRYKTFVLKGLLRMFGTAADGSEHILQFASEHSWLLEAESYDNQQPARYNIASVEPGEVLLWSKTDFDSLLASITKLKTYSEQLIQRNIYSGRNRLSMALSATPEEKYHEFTKTFPDLLPRLPLHMIAAYLGISIKTLTRIRQAQRHPNM